MELPLYNTQGEQSGTVAVSDGLMDAGTNPDLVFQVATAQQANRRQTLAHAKDRSEVRGGGRKPWRQKGTGRARHGSTRSPIWMGGGASHGPTKLKNYKKNINRSAAKKALAHVLSLRRTDGRLLVVDAFAVDGKTKSAKTLLDSLTAHLDGYVSRKDKHSRVLIVMPGTADDTAARRSLMNIQYADAIRASDLNALMVLSYPYIILTKDAVEVAQDVSK